MVWNRFGYLLIAVGTILFLLSFVPRHFAREKMLIGFRPERHTGEPDNWADRPLAPISLFIIQVGVICLFS